MTRRGLFATLAAAIAAPKLPATLAPKTATAARVFEKTYVPLRYSVGITVSRKALEEEFAAMRLIAESVEGVPLYLTDPAAWSLMPETAAAPSAPRESHGIGPHESSG